MKLAEYIKSNNITFAAFACEMGVEPPTVHRWANGFRVPSIRMAHEIKQATGGAVSFEDWLEDAKSQ